MGNIAAQNGYEGCLDFLLQCRVPALAECGRFGTPLTVARFKDHTGCVTILKK